MRISHAIIELENNLRGDDSLRKMTYRLKKDLRKLAKKKYFITNDPIHIHSRGRKMQEVCASQMTRTPESISSPEESGGL